ncbi:PREDICTED: uncharacterized protein LOC104743929 [Camelina sativa]|uniref:Uncharacterized protein LOC104743929 n=1 Tax=Camelina sativa TaxID=90675 RepID=A0ABM0VYV0_CAMSA|nr:PREDICTED: uncharacterized protein LOC104743929 [Camelina sativa]
MGDGERIVTQTLTLCFENDGSQDVKYAQQGMWTFHHYEYEGFHVDDPEKTFNVCLSKQLEIIMIPNNTMTKYDLVPDNFGLDCMLNNLMEGFVSTVSKGLNDHVKRKSIRKWLKLHQPLFGGILETHMITCQIKLPFVSHNILVSIVYASSTCASARKDLWEEIVDTATANPAIPWTALGDFNQTLFRHEHSSQDANLTTPGMRALEQCLSISSLADLPYCGNTYTWTNKHTVGLIAKKLDRILVNDEWITAFPSSLAVFGEPAFSDHSPCCLFLDSHAPKRKKPFKFLVMLNQHPDFAPLIKLWWDALAFDGTKMFVIAKKLKALKSVIREFSKTTYSGIEKRTQEAYLQLLHCQNELLRLPSTESIIQEKEVVDSKQGIQSLVVDFYENLLGNQTQLTTASVLEIADLLPQRCSPAAIQTLSTHVTPEEIRSVVFSLSKNKAPGPDGFCVEFLTSQWDTVGNSVVEAVLEFFNTGKMLKQWNATILTLVPKIPNAQRITQFRPIACCNTLYKIASKILANRLKKVLPDLISNSQSAFIQGRLLVENVLLAIELVQGFNQKNISPRGMLKIDLMKAFDSVHWGFLINTLTAMGFPARFISLIDQCISTTSFSACINGELCGYFRGARGLRQGDPLSPYLFVLAMEVFSQLLTQHFSANKIGPHPSALCPLVSHLAFADDIMVFFDGKTNSLSHIVAVLQEFSRISGLTMNLSKTELFLGGVTQIEATQMASLGFNIGSLPIRYLGLPLMHRKLRLAEYRPLLQSLTNRFSSWSSRALSYAGRQQLISSVIYGTINFWMSAFILPKGCIKKIETLCANFLWSGDVTKKGIAKMAWRDLCLPKAEGGLGFRCLSHWNKTLILKLTWRLLAARDSLWALWLKNNKIKDGCFWKLDIKKQSSGTLKSMLKLRHITSQFMKAHLGNGCHLNFWYDHWTPFGPLIDFMGGSGPAQTGISLHGSVASATNETGWNLRPARSPQAESLHIYLTSITTPLPAAISDSYSWRIGTEELVNFSTSKTWEVLRPRANAPIWTAQVWFKGAIPRHAFLFWLMHQDRLPIRTRLIRWGLQVDPSCCICGLLPETREHLFLRCKLSEDLWSAVTRRLGYRPFSFHTWDAFSAWLDLKDNTAPRSLRRLAAQATLYAIWSERNNRYHNNISMEGPLLLKRLDRQIRDAILAKQKRRNFKDLLLIWLQYD